jgi:hypothetical protein
MKNLYSPKTKNLLVRLLRETIRINSQTKYCAFFNISGHVSKLEFRLVGSKELYHDHIIRRDWIHLNNKEAEIEIQVILGEIKKRGI